MYSLIAQREDTRGVQSFVDTSASTGGVENLEKIDDIINMTNIDISSLLKISAYSEFSRALQVKGDGCS